MKECHVCFYECDDQAEICPICGAELKDDDELSYKLENNVVIENPVIAASVDSPVVAEIFKDILTENGIAYSEDLGGDIMHVGFGGSYFAVDVYVDEKDLDAARELYKNLLENELSSEPFECFDDETGDQDGE